MLPAKYNLAAVLLFWAASASCQSAEKTAEVSTVLSATPLKAAGSPVEQKAFLDSLKQPPVEVFSGQFKLTAVLPGQQQKALGRIWVDTTRGLMKIRFLDPVFESKINTIVVKPGQGGNLALFYDHLRREKYEVPARFMQLQSLLGDYLSLDNFIPLLQNRLPAEVFNGQNRLVVPKKELVYLKTPHYEALYNFGGGQLKRIVLKEKTRAKKVFILIDSRMKVGQASFPRRFRIENDDRSQRVTIEFTRIRPAKKAPDRWFDFP